ncbi:MAG: hypothetical protein WC867_01190 [Candidatus Pacearchaeota archaeon]|jgi:hypothetical protein
MELKVIFGIVIPLCLMIIIGIIGSLDIGSVNKVYSKQILVRDLFKGDNIRDSIKIGEVYIDNQHFITKRFDLENMGVCLKDLEGAKETLEAGNIEYSEGDYLPDDLYNSRSNSDKSVEVKANSKKTVKIFLRPSYSYYYQNQDQLIEKYKDYDELLIYEKNGNKGIYYNYDSCYNLNSETLANAIHISIVS